MGMMWLALAGPAHAQWTAFNDHGSGASTYSHTTRYHVFGDEEGTNGPLRNIVTGEELPVTLSMVRSGFIAADALGSPPAQGTPLALAFDGFVEFESEIENIGTRFSSKVTMTLDGLTPGQAYRIQGGAVRGGDFPNQRWTLLELMGAENYEAFHSSGVLTSNEVPGLLPNQAAANFGANHTLQTGDMMDWLIHDAGSDGRVQLVFGAYSGELPDGAPTEAVGYVPTALKVQEIVDEAAITIVSHPEPQTVFDGESAAFSVRAIGSPLAYQWFRDGSPVAGATGRTHRIPAVDIRDNGSLFSVQVHNSFYSVTSTQALLTVLLPSEELVSLGDQWRFDASGLDLGTEWRAPTFDDSAWQTGAGPLGFPANEPLPVPIATVIPNHGGITYYFRTHFTTYGDKTDFRLWLTNMIDDGAVFYINGEEVLRVSMPAPPTPIEYSTPATVGGEFEYRIDPVPTRYLREGTNTLAVEVHQINLTSSDMVMGVAMTGEYIPPTELEIIAQPSDVTTEEGVEIRLTVDVQGSGAHYQWYKDGEAIPDATSAQLIFPVVTIPDSGAYFVTVSNVFSYLISETALLEVSGDQIPPDVLEADGSVSPAGDQVRVTFSEPVTQVTATNLAHYQLQSSDGTMLDILAASWSGEATVFLTTEPRAAGQTYLLTVNGVADQSLSTNVISPGRLVAVRDAVPVVALDGAWHFYDPVPGFDPPLSGSEWLQPTFSMDGWSFGPAAFVKDPEGTAWPVTPQTPLSGAGIVSYFRFPFHFDASPFGAKLLLRHAVDAGAAFYVNTREVHRFNLPPDPLTDTTLASGELPVTLLEWVSLSGDEALRWGSNVFAVELHGSSPDDADRFFAAELVVSVSSFATGPVLFLAHPESTTVREGGSVTFTTELVGARGLQWTLDKEPLEAANHPRFTIARVPLRLDGVSLQVLATNQSDVAFSEPAILTVLPDLTAPRMVSARGSAGTSTILVAFDEPLDPASAVHEPNYHLAYAEGALLDVTGASLVNPSLVLLEVASPLQLAPLVLTVSGVIDAAAARNPVKSPTRWLVGMSGLLLPMGSHWSYDDSGMDLGVAWRDPATDVSAWPAGPGPLGFPENELLPLGLSIQTVLTKQRLSPTYYFRTSFSMPAWTNGVVVLSNLVDDGAVFYANDREIHRVRMSEGDISFDTWGNMLGDLGTDLTFVDVVSVPTSEFQAGENIFAVEVHNHGIDSSDIVFGSEVFLDIPSHALPPRSDAGRLWIVREAGVVVLSWDTGETILEQAEILEGTNTLWTPVPDAASPHAIPTSAAARFYRLRD